MNMVEGFFGVGAIIGPAIVTQLLAHGASWKWLFAIAGLLCIGLILVAAVVRYPSKTRIDETPVTLAATVRMMGNPFALTFSAGAMLYVGVETAIYVWMPTLLQGYHGPYLLLSTYALSAFFVLRAGGRFLGSFMLAHMKWSLVLVLCAGAILACFAVSYIGGVNTAVWSLPLSGLFMSVIYPTLNSKGISCFPKSQHGAVSGVILFFTCLSAVLSPLAMGAISDAMGDPKYGFGLAAAFSAILFAFLVFNLIKDPTRTRLARLNETEY
jgi:fucose permease